MIKRIVTVLLIACSACGGAVAATEEIAPLEERVAAAPAVAPEPAPLVKGSTSISIPFVSVPYCYLPTPPAGEVAPIASSDIFVSCTVNDVGVVWRASDGTPNPCTGHAQCCRVDDAHCGVSTRSCKVTFDGCACIIDLGVCSPL